MAGGFRPLTLQQKVTAVLVSVVGAMVGLSYLVLSTTVSPAFETLERTVAEINLVRAKRAIEADLETLAAVTGDWGPWDDAYQFVRGERPEFVESNLDRPTLENLGLDMMMFYDSQGRPVWRQVLQAEGTFDPDLLDLAGDSAGNGLVTHAQPDSRIDGLLRTPLGPMLVSSRPIVPSAKLGPIAGTVVMGQLLDREHQEGLRERTEVDLEWHPLDEDWPLDPSVREALLAGAAGDLHHVPTEGSIRSFTLLPDLFGEPLLILQANTPRQISSLGHSTAGGALWLLAVGGLVLAAVTWWLLRSSIVLPLERLAGHITGIRKSGDLALRLNEDRKDEIGALASEFDLMTQKLDHARQLLLEQSFKAGKADIAADVLHNVRNAMTPLINGIERLSGSLRFTGSLRVMQAADELRDPECAPDRRARLLEYITAAFEHVRSTSDEAVSDLATAARQARQVEAILDAQEKHAGAAAVVEEFDLQGVLEEAALVLPVPGRGGIRLNLERNAGSFRIRGHRVRLLQVLGRLVLNASDSIERSGAEAGEIEVSAFPEEGAADDMVRITVRDTGCGFEEGVRRKLFQAGYTSTSGNPTGLGLHWCANAVASMGGRMLAESPGPGSGAEFHVILPAVTSGPHGLGHKAG